MDGTDFSLAGLTGLEQTWDMGRRRTYRRRPANVARFSRRSSRRHPRSRRTSFGYVQAMLAAIGLSLGVLAGLVATGVIELGGAAPTFQCSSPRVLDGDTLDCGAQRIRLQGIDAPELPGHCRPGRDCTPGDPYASTANLGRLVNGKTMECRKIDTDVYGRTVARCSVGEIDLSCAQIEGGYAIRRYGVIFC